MRVCPKCSSVFVTDVKHCGIDGAKLKSTDRDPLIGATIDRYAFVDALGSGGMGAVYRARHTGLDREVAIKVLWGDLSSKAAFVERFRREARAMSKIQHTNITSVLDFLTLETGMSCLVMEYVPGPTLTEVIRSSGRTDVAFAADVTRQIAAGLQEAHRLGFVHRDLKPSNIILTELAGERVVKVLDFGNVGIVGEDPKNDKLTQTGLIVGTPVYMAPEQAEQNAGPSADLYALGVILYEMLSGAPPFRSNKLNELLAMHVHKPPIPLADHGGLEQLAIHLLGKKPEQRPANAATVIAAIDVCFPTDAGGRPARPEPSTERLWQMAANRLRALGLDIYFAENAIRGTCEVDPNRFERVDGAGIATRHLELVALEHDSLGFVAPVAVRGLGAFVFSDLPGREALVERIEQRWSRLAQHTRNLLERAREYVQSATVVEATWTIETTVADRIGELSFRFDPQCTQMELVAIRGEPLSTEDARTIPTIALPDEPKDFDYYGALQSVIDRAHELEDVRGEVTADILDLTDRRAVRLEADADDGLKLMILADTHVGRDGADGAAQQRLGLDNPIHLRLPRLRCDVAATMTWSGKSREVPITNVNARGVFVGIENAAAPRIDEVVELSGFGPRSIRARVRHRRPLEEANLLGSREGVGLAFEPEGGRSSSPVALLALASGSLGERIRGTLSCYGCRAVSIDNLVAAAVSLFTEHTVLIVADESIAQVRWHALGAGLDIIARGTRFVIVDGRDERPDWAEAVDANQVNERRIRSWI